MVNSSFCNERIVGSTFLDLTMFDHDDVICLLHGLESVSDDDDGSVFEEGVECLRDLLFAEGVEC